MEATLTFLKRQDAEKFSIKWTRFSKTGTTVGSGMTNVKVVCYNVTQEGKDWIDKYIKNNS